MIGRIPVVCREVLKDFYMQIITHLPQPQQLQQLQAQMRGQFASEVVTEFKMTEISIEIDEYGNIEHRETTIEHTQEIRFDDGQK